MDDIISVSGREKADSSRIILYPEGIFYKAYGYSAFRFIRHIRTYRAKKHFFKKLNGEICSIGFPRSVLEQLVPTGCEVVVYENRVEINGSFAAIAESDYQQWVHSVPLVGAKPREASAVPPVQPPLPPADAHAAGVIRSLQEFAIESATPLECMMFLSELKRRLNQ